MILPQTDFANTYILQVYASIKDTRIGARKLANFVKMKMITMQKRSNENKSIF